MTVLPDADDAPALAVPLFQPIDIWTNNNIWTHSRSQLWKRLFTTLLVLLPFFIQVAANRTMIWFGMSLKVRLVILTLAVLGSCGVICLVVMSQILLDFLIDHYPLPDHRAFLWSLLSSMMLDLLPEPILGFTGLPAVPLLTPGTVLTLTRLNPPIQKDLLGWLIFSLSLMLGSSGLFS